MAFSSEVRFKIGADTSSVDIALASLPAKAAQASASIKKEASGLEIFSKSAQAAVGSVIERKFGMKDVFKGLLQGIGIGSIEAITQAVVAPFQHAAERAKALVNLTDTLRENTNRWLGALGGPTEEFRLQIKEVNDLNRMIGEQKALIAGLKANPLNLVGNGLEQVKEAEVALDDLIKKQDGIATAVKIAALQENRRNESLQRQGALARELAAIEFRHGVEGQTYEAKRAGMLREYNELKKQGALPSSLQSINNEISALDSAHRIFTRNQDEKKADIRRAQELEHELFKIEMRDGSERERMLAKLNALRKEGEVLKQRTGAQSPEVAQNRAQQNSLKLDIELLANKTGEAVAAALKQMGGDLANSQPSKRPQRRPRGRTESERLADRAENFLDDADEAVRKRGDPNFVARMVKAAARDRETVGKKIGVATEKVDPNDAKGLGNHLSTANSHLQKIKENLDPAKIN